MNLLIAFLLLGFGTPTPAMAQQISSTTIVYSSTTAELIIESYAAHYGTPAEPLINTLACESHLRANAPGDFDVHTKTYTSWGVAQIHLSAHPGITKAQALDPFFAIDWAAREFSLGHQGMWSCYKKLYN